MGIFWCCSEWRARALSTQISSACAAKIVHPASVQTLMSSTFTSTACSSSPCLHDGTCILDSSHTYRCACLGGYTGKNCENGEFQSSSTRRLLISRYSHASCSLGESLGESWCLETKNISSHREPLPRRIIVPLMHYKKTCSHEANACGLEAAEACCLLPAFPFHTACFWLVSLSRRLTTDA